MLLTPMCLFRGLPKSLQKDGAWQAAVAERASQRRSVAGLRERPTVDDARSMSGASSNDKEHSNHAEIPRRRIEKP